MVMFPLKKNSRLARLGEQPPHQKYKNEGGERFCIQKLLSPHSKAILTGFTSLQPQGHHFSHFFDSVLRFYSSPTSKYLILEFSSFPLMYFGLLLVGMCSNMWGNFGFVSCFIGLSQGVVRDDLRPMLHSGVMGHATLPPFSCYSCLNMRPPSAR